MPRYSGVSKKRNKQARATKMYHARRQVLNLINNSNTSVEEDAHLKYFKNLPEENLPELNIEIEAKDTQNFGEEELRIVSPLYLLKQGLSMYQHEKRCTMGKFKFANEKREGLKSMLYFRCSGCEKKFTLRCSPPRSEEKRNINYDCIWGLMSIGSGYNQGQELFSIMNIPFMQRKTYTKYEKEVAKTWENNAVLQMNKNAAEEKSMAIEAGDIEDGIPFITVIVDGGWAKRSYGHGYSSLSGVACIIGSRTKKLLYLGVKNKFCYVCAVKGKNHNHKCYKNFSGSSTSMEQSIIVEGFNSSEQTYGIRYKYMVGDGDSSVYARVLQNVSYGRYVLKLECANHVTRACVSHLYKLIKNCSFDTSVRQIVKNNLIRFSKHLRLVISNSEKNSLKSNLINVPFHVFGDHKNCSQAICKQREVINVIELLQSSQIWDEILKINNRVVVKSHQLSENLTTNYAEQFMATVAKFTGGKRTNLIQRGGYQNRCFGATLMYNLGYDYHKLSVSNNFSKNHLDIFCRRRNKAREASKRSYKKSKQYTVIDEDADYGSTADEPDDGNKKSLEELEVLASEITRQLDSANVEEIQLKTIGQSTNINWIIERRNRITASMFGKICKLRSKTDRTNTVKLIFYSNHYLRTAAINYGIENEKNAIEMYERLKNRKVARCGLFVYNLYKFLGASPDGIVDDETIVEVKCLFSIRKSKIKEAAERTNNLCVKVINNELFLKENDKYMYQIQGQLLITNRQKCDLILYTDVDLEVVSIAIDRDFCDKMLKQLKQFWFEYGLPELADPKIPLNKKVQKLCT